MIDEHPAYTEEDIPHLDELHDAVGLGTEWRNSDRRAELLGHTMVESPVGYECSICWACPCHSKEFLLKLCEGLQLKTRKKEH